ncbi:hypothetical protein ACWF99_22695 [Nocardia sp. NPDC055002]
MNSEPTRPPGLRIIAKGEVTRILTGPATDRESRIAAVSAAADQHIERTRQNGQLPTPVRRSGMPHVPNERLEQALREAGIRPEQLAKKIGVTPTTVERWLDNNDRIPYPVHQFAVEKIIGADISEIWPDRSSSAPKSKHPALENHRLRDALFDARITPAQIAERLGVTETAVASWLARGRVPQRKVRDALALEVGVPARELWPTPQRPNRYAPERSQSRPDSTGGADADTTSDCSASPRLRALMSWVDTSGTQRTTQHRDPDFGRRRRGDGLEHTR